MTIATQQDVIDYLGSGGEVALAQMTDPAGAFIDSTLVAKHLSYADDEFYSYVIPTGITVPLETPYPPLPRRICAIFAVNTLWVGDVRPERLKTDYAWAIGIMKSFQAGKQSLGLVADSSAPVEQAENLVKYISSDAVFSREELESY